MILLNNNFEHTVEKVKSDPNRNYIILDINIDGKKFTLVNLYDPNKDKPRFYKESMQGYKLFNNDNTMEPRHDKTNKISVYSAKTQISRDICPAVHSVGR